ncbi:MAG: SDR family NAD(P)-dependent oxidoreductase [Solirubrobacteraceae bacterium]|nr:SDR family NAD(P)-dependent oxidoreductase [Solirubrobacteraceae bacterium]
MVICITGASSGIGEATALRLAREPGARMVLVARRGDRLARLADRLPCPATTVAVDLTDDDAPARVRAHVEAEHGGRLDVLVNNAGASWRARFADGGWENVRRTMAINFDAHVRLTEALLPLVRASAPSTIVNVSSTSGRIARAGAGAYCASKFALCGWSDALGAEERPNGVNVALVLPGFIHTEGFPQRELPGFLVSEPDVVADAIADCVRNGRIERYAPRWYWLAAAVRILLPRGVRRFTSSKAGSRLVTATRPGDGA